MATNPSAEQGLTGWVARISAAGMLAVLLLLLGLCLVATLAGYPNAQTFGGQILELKRGSGELTDAGFLVRGPTGRDQSILLSPLIRAPAASAGRLSWDAIGLRPEQTLRLLWRSTAAPGRVLAYSPSSDERDKATADLSDKPGWDGEILQVGILLRGPLPEPVLIASLSLGPAAGACRTLFDRLLAVWMHREPWSQRSINFSLSGERGVLGITPVLFVALWIPCAALILGLLSRRTRVGARFVVSALLLFLLIGWMALDVRWQLQLWGRLADSYSRYAALQVADRPKAAPDGHLFELVQALRSQLPSQPARVLVISAEPNGYLAARTAYHLLPHRVHDGLSHLPDVDEVAAGDYLFVMDSLKAAHYDNVSKSLSMNGTSLPVEPVTAIRGFGVLFRVRAGS